MAFRALAAEPLAAGAGDGVDMEEYDFQQAILIQQVGEWG